MAASRGTNATTQSLTPYLSTLETGAFSIGTSIG